MPTSATLYFPFDSGAGANVTEDQWRKMGRFWLASGPIGNTLNDLRPFGDSTGLQCKVDTGAAWIQGHYGEWTAGTSILPIAAVGGIAGGQERWDRIVARADFTANLVQLDILTGTAGAPPGPLPALTQSTSKWEEVIADVGPLVNTTTTVTSGMVLDRRVRVGPAGPHHIEVYRAAALSIANGFVFTDLPFDTVESARGSDYSTTTGIYTTPVAGRYLVSATVSFNVAAGGVAGLSLVKNGTEIKRLGAGYAAANNPGVSGAAVVRCATAGDTLKIQVAQSTATNPAALFVGAVFCWVQITYLGPL